MKILMLCLILSTTIQAAWQVGKEKCGITVSLDRVPGSKIKKYKVEGVIESPPQFVVSALLDFPNVAKWHHNMSQAKFLKKIDENTYLAYMELDFPWPVKNRDSIATSTLSIDGDISKIVLKKYPYKVINPKNVVVTTTNGYWMVSPDPRGARVVHELHAEPGGKIPNFIINMLLMKSPYKTFKGLRSFLNTKPCL